MSAVVPGREASRVSSDERNLFPATSSRSSVGFGQRRSSSRTSRALCGRSFTTTTKTSSISSGFRRSSRRMARPGWSTAPAGAALHLREHRGLHYHVVAPLVNAADYGIPQRRERVFIVAFRSDLGIEWNFPNETHSQDVLHPDKYVTREYWDCVRSPRPGRPFPSPFARQRRAADHVASVRPRALENRT